MCTFKCHTHSERIKNIAEEQFKRRKASECRFPKPILITQCETENNNILLLRLFKRNHRSTFCAISTP